MTRSAGLPKRAGNWARSFCGPDVGEQVEPLAQRTGGIDAALVHRRIVVMRDRAEDDAVRRLCGFECALRKGRALRCKCSEADLHLLERELDLPDAGRRAQHAERRGRDLRRDAVAVQHAEADRGGVGRHMSLCVPGVAQHAMMRCRPGTAKSDVRAVPHLRCIAKRRCIACGTRTANSPRWPCRRTSS